jgi:N-methylhydantoinase A/oxoprolinase/acetone carboxylase beta subunit
MGKKLRLQVIGCGVFEEELRALAARSANDLDVRLLDAGLHSAPERLRLEAQQAVDEAARKGGYDAVCLAYGLCGRGTTGLVARDVPLVIPRAHDCIALFLGSARAYAEQFALHPGTFYFTTGWYNKKAHPEQTRMAAARRFDPAVHPHFREFSDRYGEENARYIIEFLESWRRNYSRAALVDHGFATPEHVRTTQAVAEAAGWKYERIEGSLELLRALVEGDWAEDRFLVVPAGHVVVATNDARLLACVPAPAGADLSAAVLGADAAARVETGSFVYGEPGPGEAPDVGLGIDAGGTYTDAVLYEFATGRVLSKAKAITTHYDLVQGIGEAVADLDALLLGRVSYTCLSTTLATNAIVEGRGWPVGLLLMPFHEGSARRIKTPLFRCLSARMDIGGVPSAPVDEGEVLAAAEEMLREGAASFAVSGYGAVRNPEHEVQVRDMLRRRWDLPVVCGHELSGRLNFIERAHTAVLNARLLPLVTDLLRSVEQALATRGVGGRLFVVRGDGAVMLKDVARVRAVETILSGPAASAAGGCFLTGRDDALVVDVGGTTTDLAVLSGGRAALSAEGARVGHWRTSVTAVDVQTVGLGGDSSVRPDGRGRVNIGPERVVPLCYLAFRWPQVLEELERLAREQARGSLGPEMFDFFVRVRSGEGLALDPAESRIMALLAERPWSRLDLSSAVGALASHLLRMRRLEQVGLVRRAGVTPTDALHVLGEFEAFSGRAAEMAMGMLGRFLGLDAAACARLVRGRVEQLLALAIMRRELSADGLVQAAEGLEDAERLLERMACGGGGGSFAMRWQQHRAVVGIGAPAMAFLPGACRLLGTQADVPQHADVANAIGAVTSQVVVRDTVRIRPGEFGSYVLYGADGRREFSRLEDAESAARQQIVETVRRRARSFGTLAGRVRVDVSRRVGRLQDGSTQLLEVVVAGLLKGPPAWQTAGES